jgi:hypothetical protein
MTTKIKSHLISTQPLDEMEVDKISMAPLKLLYWQDAIFFRAFFRQPDVNWNKYWTVQHANVLRFVDMNACTTNTANLKDCIGSKRPCAASLIRRLGTSLPPTLYFFSREEWRKLMDEGVEGATNKPISLEKDNIVMVLSENQHLLPHHLLPMLRLKVSGKDPRWEVARLLPFTSWPDYDSMHRLKFGSAGLRLPLFPDFWRKFWPVSVKLLEDLTSKYLLRNTVFRPISTVKPGGEGLLIQMVNDAMNDTSGGGLLGATEFWGSVTIFCITCLTREMTLPKATDVSAVVSLGALQQQELQVLVDSLPRYVFTLIWSALASFQVLFEKKFRGQDNTAMSRINTKVIAQFCDTQLNMKLSNFSLSEYWRDREVRIKNDRIEVVSEEVPVDSPAPLSGGLLGMRWAQRKIAQSAVGSPLRRTMQESDFRQNLKSTDLKILKEVHKKNLAAHIIRNTVPVNNKYKENYVFSRDCHLFKEIALMMFLPDDVKAHSKIADKFNRLGLPQVLQQVMSGRPVPVIFTCSALFMLHMVVLSLASVQVGNILAKFLTRPAGDDDARYVGYCWHIMMSPKVQLIEICDTAMMTYKQEIRYHASNLIKYGVPSRNLRAELAKGGDVFLALTQHIDNKVLQVYGGDKQNNPGDYSSMVTPLGPAMVAPSFSSFGNGIDLLS